MEAFQIGAPEVALINVISIRPASCIDHEPTQFAVEIVSQLGMLGTFVIVHDLIYIGTDAPMKD